MSHPDVARRLASALSQAQGRQREQQAQLAARASDLRELLVHANREDLVLQRDALDAAVRQLEAQCEEVEGRIASETQALERLLAETHVWLEEQTAAQKQAHAGAKLSAEFDEAVNHFSKELEALGLGVSSSPAQLRGALGRLQSGATKVRTRIKETLDASSKELSDQASLREQLDALVVVAKELSERESQARARILQGHTKPGVPMPLLDDLGSLTPRVLARLRRDALLPLFSDAYVERTFRLVGPDPLREIVAALRRRR